MPYGGPEDGTGLELQNAIVSFSSCDVLACRVKDADDNEHDNVDDEKLGRSKTAGTWEADLQFPDVWNGESMTRAMQQAEGRREKYMQMAGKDGDPINAQQLTESAGRLQREISAMSVAITLFGALSRVGSFSRNC